MLIIYLPAHRGIRQFIRWFNRKYARRRRDNVPPQRCPIMMRLAAGIARQPREPHATSRLQRILPSGRRGYTNTGSQVSDGRPADARFCIPRYRRE